MQTYTPLDYSRFLIIQNAPAAVDSVTRSIAPKDFIPADSVSGFSMGQNKAVNQSWDMESHRYLGGLDKCACQTAGRGLYLTALFECLISYMHTHAICHL